MKIKSSYLKEETKLKYLVENASTGALLYLILPLSHLIFYPMNLWSLTLVITVSLFSLTRFFWPSIYKNHKSKYYLYSLGVVVSILSLSSSLLAAETISHSINQQVALFSTIFIATMSSGVMAAFNASPKMSALQGVLVLLPFSIHLSIFGQGSPVLILGGCVLFHLWNMIQVKRSYKNYVHLQNAEEVIHFQKQRLHEFLELLPGSVSWLDNELNYLDANSKLSEFVGKNKEEIIGKNLGFLSPDDPLVNRIRQFKNSNSPREIFEIKLPFKGDEKYLLANLMRCKINDFEEQICVLCLDITSLKDQEADLEKRRLILLTQEKYAALGEMAGGIAHEINNPLAIICGKVDVLKNKIERGTLTPEDLNRHLVGIGDTAKRIVRIIKSMRVLLRDGRVEDVEDTTVGSVLEPLYDIMQSRLDSLGVPLEFDREGFDMAIRCGAAELGQVIMNLVVNGAQAVESQPEKWVKVKVKSLDGYIGLMITDSGHGISEEIAKNLFQPFFTTKPVGVGTGLGLSVSRELMKKQGGNLYLQQGEKNTTFVIELPSPLVSQNSKNHAA